MLNEQTKNGFLIKMNFTLTRAGQFWNFIIEDAPFHEYVKPFSSFRKPNQLKIVALIVMRLKSLQK